jgi:hypothetical protein
MKKFVETISFHRGKEDNFEIEERAKQEKFPDSTPTLYIGYEVIMEIEVGEDGNCKVLEINGIDISDKEVFI